jgi:hypothetical protein
MSMVDLAVLKERCREDLERTQSLLKAAPVSSSVRAADSTQAASRPLSQPISSSSPVVSMPISPVNSHRSAQRNVTFQGDEPPLAVTTFNGQPFRRLRGSPSPSPGSVVDRRLATIYLRAFTESNIPLDIHLAKLANCSSHYGWREADRVCHLKTSLEGPAATIL